MPLEHESYTCIYSILVCSYTSMLFTEIHVRSLVLVCLSMYMVAIIVNCGRIVSVFLASCF
ncbi:hypothetical protein LINPERHAP2_LOCUS11547 [Linum perenne]